VDRHGEHVLLLVLRGDDNGHVLQCRAIEPVSPADAGKVVCLANVADGPQPLLGVV
jgi:hypothetical protein